jgi:hypothetical protein
MMKYFIIILYTFIVLKQNIVTYRPFLGNELANTFPRRYDCWKPGRCCEINARFHGEVEVDS